MVVLSLLTVLALAARARRRDGYALTRLEVLHSTANDTNDARDFVPQHHRFFDAHRPKTTMVVVMQIRSTNATIGDIDLQLVRTQSICIQGV